MASKNNMLQPQLPHLMGKKYKQWSIQMNVLYGSRRSLGDCKKWLRRTGESNQSLITKIKHFEGNQKKDKKALYFIYQAVDEVIF